MTRCPNISSIYFTKTIDAILSYLTAFPAEFYQNKLFIKINKIIYSF